MLFELTVKINNNKLDMILALNNKKKLLNLIEKNKNKIFNDPFYSPEFTLNINKDKLNRTYIKVSIPRHDNIAVKDLKKLVKQYRTNQIDENEYNNISRQILNKYIERLLLSINNNKIPINTCELIFNSKKYISLQIMYNNPGKFSQMTLYRSWKRFSTEPYKLSKKNNINEPSTIEINFQNILDILKKDTLLISHNDKAITLDKKNWLKFFDQFTNKYSLQLLQDKPYLKKSRSYLYYKSKKNPLFFSDKAIYPYEYLIKYSIKKFINDGIKLA
jgi:hypothetical protein